MMRETCLNCGTAALSDATSAAAASWGALVAAELAARPGETWLRLVCPECGSERYWQPEFFHGLA